MVLTKEFQPYDGDYEKEMQDIKLHDGTIIEFCYPNAGVWNTPDGFEIDNNDVAEVRLTQKEGLW